MLEFLSKLQFSKDLVQAVLLTREHDNIRRCNYDDLNVVIIR